MNKFISIFLSLLLSTSYVFANEDKTSDNKTDLIITHKIEKNVVDLPDCNNPILLENVKNFIIKYLEENKKGSAAYKRRRYFILHNITDFSKENVANYKTQSTRPVSDFIINLKINQDIIEENMLLCKNKSLNKEAENLYTLTYPQDDGYKTYIINLDNRVDINNMSFFYKLTD